MINLMGGEDGGTHSLIREIVRVNDDNAKREGPEWVDVQVSYRLKGSDTILREDIMHQQAPEVPELLARLARHVRSTYSVMSVDALTSHTERSRIVTFMTEDLLFIDVRSMPYVPPQTDEDERRAKLRGRSR